MRKYKKKHLYFVKSTGVIFQILANYWKIDLGTHQRITRKCFTIYCLAYHKIGDSSGLYKSEFFEKLKSGEYIPIDKKVSKMVTNFWR